MLRGEAPLTTKIQDTTKTHSNKILVAQHKGYARTLPHLSNNFNKLMRKDTWQLYRSHRKESNPSPYLNYLGGGGPPKAPSVLELSQSPPPYLYYLEGGGLPKAPSVFELS